MANPRNKLLNELLVLLLERQRGIVALPPQRSQATNLEFTVAAEGKRTNHILLEASLGESYSTRRKAVSRARARLAKRPDALAFAVCYPPHLRESESISTSKKNLAESILAFAPIHRFGDGPVWREGTVADLAATLLAADLSRQYVVAAIEGSVQASAELLRTADCAGELARALKIPAKGKDRDAAPLLAGMILSNAALLHHRLRSVPDLVDRSPLAQALDLPERAVERLRDVWESFLDTEFGPVFAPAVAVLRVVPLPLLERTIQGIAKTAVQVADELPALPFEDVGPLCHRLLASAKVDGAVYTNSVAALLAARLALPAEGRPWSDSAALAGLRVIDPACGTGTLLVAAMHTIRERVAQADADERQSVAEQGALPPDLLYGLDISEHHIHLAASRLLLGESHLGRRPLPLFTLPHGPQSGDGAAAGSLELLANSPAVSPPGESLAGRFDVVITNPPVVRHDPRTRGYDVRSRRLLQQREAEVAERLGQADRDAAKAIDHGNLRTFFSPLADVLLQKADGVLVELLPTTVLTGTSSLDERRFLADRFQIETILTSHDPRCMNFSENSTTQESLLVARRPRPQRQPTRFVSIGRMPRDMHEAGLLAERINRREQLGKWGGEHAWPWSRVRTGDWSAAQFYDGVLAEAVCQLASLVGSCLEPVGDLCYVDPTADRVRDTFSTEPVDGARWTCEMLWRHTPRERVTMTARPDIVAAPRPERERFAKHNLIKNASRLLVANRLHTGRVRVSACYAERPLLGYAWTPVIPVAANPAFERALCAWWNSTPGILTFLHARTRQLTYPHYSLDSLRAMLVPDPGRIDIGPLVEAFDKACTQALRPWPEMHLCNTRTLLDNAVAQVLRIDSRAISDWRQRVAREPTVTGKPAGK